MKKILFAVIMLSALFCTAQTNPYFGLGTSIADGTFSYSGELGLYNDDFSLALGDEFYQTDSSTENYASIRSYFNMFSNSGITFNWYNAAKVHTNEQIDLIFETGFAVALGNFKNFVPQVSVTTYFGEGVVPFIPATLSLGFSLNYLFPSKCN